MANSFTYQEKKFHTGDTVKLYLNVTESGKTRNQIFEGIIIAIKNEGPGQSITVRKMASNNIGVERIVPLGSPTLTNIELKSAGKVRRAKLYYLRDRVGKQASKVKLKTTTNTKKTNISSEKKSSRPARRKSSQKVSEK
ncbi:50S ribosomal protein L19 [Pseudomonadota bacterium]